MVDTGSVRDYIDESICYESLGDRLMADSNTLILTGHNCGLKVVNNALHVRTGYKHAEDREPMIYYRGAAPVHQIIILSRSGNISIDALYWCRDQEISVLLLDGMGNLAVSISPEYKESVLLRRLQYQSNDTGMRGYIAREIVRHKTTSQIEVLRMFPELREGSGTITLRLGRRVILIDSARGKAIRYICDQLESGLDSLARMTDIDAIRALEGNLAACYWNAFVGIPLQWTAKDVDKVPPHWKVITDRMSTMSGTSPRHAINPFQSALNYLYSVAEHQLLVDIRASGFDPACGFLHYDKESRDSLVYDLIEPHRAEIDRRVLEFFRGIELKRGDMVMMPSGQIMLNSEFSRYLILSCKIDEIDFASTVSWLKKQLTGLK